MLKGLRKNNEAGKLIRPTGEFKCLEWSDTNFNPAGGKGPPHRDEPSALDVASQDETTGIFIATSH
ncbi:hypothetical protein BO70DRAFT_426526 [Aspergillus heteromorphus CBS 117.55]|uniref:Uncharacterized protein n=1 Tax=Aspergillus heteromorphus CBS 117.55 TaxID=1448321 RepID=A0A317WUP2_9EURO|nr:uncharacterized protein BO70DRAFT_426526 [Aspergillus heteromorphus CBS 117.55]PWY90143.1 hypothetical protein BO70DRAFT_426526 [Aspergillus heteromorphus CBS 117.55]